MSKNGKVDVLEFEQKESSLRSTSGAVDEIARAELEKDVTKVTCDVLCSLSTACSPTVQPSSPCSDPYDEEGDEESFEKRRPGSKCCSKQLQLPMFLSKTYHMIDKCDFEIASWSESGDNFVVKNVEKFASHVLPLYFKHSNFSSFARQLNFYGFRKLRSDPILTSDVDPRTSCYVRFYHEKFQKDKPELLHQIKRATKTDQQSKDDVDSLRQEISKLREMLSVMSSEYDRKLAELSYDCNRRISAMNVEYDKLATLVHRALGVDTTAASLQPPADLLHSLSQAAVSLQNHLRSPQVLAAAQGLATGKRGLLSEDEGGKKRTSRARLG